MKHKKSLERLERVFACFMALGTLLCIFLLPISNIAGANEKLKEQAAKQRERDEKAAAMERTVMGDVYDRSGIPIITVSGKDEVPEYRDDSAYSVTVGFRESEIGSHLLLKNFEQDLLHTDGTNKGRSLTLTLDARLQEYAYQLITKGEGERGSITVLDAKTGEVLAMAFYPSFSISQMRIRCEEDGYQTPWSSLIFGDHAEALSNPLCAPSRPGSVYKIVTGIGILEEGLDSIVIDDGGTGVYEDERIKISNSNNQAYGPLDFMGGFANSSNIYFGRMTYEYLGWKTFREISERCLVGIWQSYDFGDMQSTFDSEAEPYDETEPNEMLAKSGFGYGNLQLTGLHVAMLAQGIANEGIMCSPHMVQSVNKTEGIRTGENQYDYQKGEETESESYSRMPETETVITNNRVADKIKEAMKAAYRNVEYSRGTEETTEEGLVLNGTLYPIALKTGTADLDEEGNHNIWMVSFAPADDPKYVIAVNRYHVYQKYGADLFGDTISMYKMLFRNE